METYCVSPKKNTVNENSIIRKTKQKRLILLSNCPICGKKKLTLIEIKNYTNLMISLKRIKPLTNSY